MVKSHKACTGRTPGVPQWGGALLAALILSGCATALGTDVEIGLRNPTVPLGGTSRFEASRFAGTWVTVACLGVCAPEVRYRVAPEGVILRETAQGQTAYQVSAPGVLRAVEGDDTLVVMWVDDGFRTAAVGDAQGRWAAVLDRKRRAGPDRVRAAAEILDFNGWDIRKLTPVAP